MARQSNWKTMLNNVCLTVSKLEIPNFEKKEEKISFVKHVDTLVDNLNNIISELDKKIKRTAYCDKLLTSLDEHTDETIITHKLSNQHRDNGFDSVGVDKKTNSIIHENLNRRDIQSQYELPTSIKTTTIKYDEIQNNTKETHKNTTAGVVIVHDTIKQTVLTHKSKRSPDLIKEYKLLIADNISQNNLPKHINKNDYLEYLNSEKGRL